MNKSKRVINNLVGQRFGKLVVIEYDHTMTGKDKNAYWICQCDCGKTKSTKGTRLVAQRALSCGCIGIEKSKKIFWKGCGDLSGNTFSAYRCGSKSRNLLFDITIEDAWNQFVKQDGKCAFTGEQLYLYKEQKQKKLQTASLDRIDSSKGYTKDNIQWIHKNINKMKWDLPEKEFIEWCKKIANFRK